MSQKGRGGDFSILKFSAFEESEVFAVYFIWLSRHMFLIYFVLGRFFYYCNTAQMLFA